MGKSEDDGCLVCGQASSNVCSSCRWAAYCSKAHQKQHWKVHKPNCSVYEVKESQRLGRFLAAKRDIRRGEIVVKEEPLVSGPPHTSGPVCLSCYTHLTEESARPCAECGWPMCSDTCARSPAHKAECSWTKDRRQAKVKISQFVSPHPSYSCITPLRGLFLKESNPKAWENLTGLESHSENRKRDGRYEQDRFSVAALLRRFYKLEDEFSDEEILHIAGVMQINGHEVPLSEQNYISVYWKCSFLEHSCLPNCSKTFTDSGEILIRAAVDIPKGSHLSISYTDPLWSTPARRQHLLLTKYFSCLCPRCVDPTEGGSYFSSIRCPLSDCEGIMLPKCFIKDFENWFCRKCRHKMPGGQVADICAQVASEMTTLADNNIAAYQSHIQRAVTLVGENNCGVVEAKLALAQMIGQAGSNGLEDVDDSLLTVKEELCRQLISLAENIFRAENRIRGVLYFELHAAVAEHARREVKGRPNSLTFQSGLLESGGYLERVQFFLKYEPQVLPEGKIYQQSIVNLRDLQKLYKAMGIVPPAYETSSTC